MEIYRLTWVSVLITGAVGSPFLVQMPSSLKVTTGEPFSLNCSLRNGRLDPDYLWYRGFNRSTASVVPSHSGRMFYSSDENGASLRVTGSRRADSGQYFCAVSHNGEKIFSDGTQVYVKDSRCLAMAYTFLNAAKLLLVLTVSVELLCLAKYKKINPQRKKRQFNMEMHSHEETCDDTAMTEIQT
ncbi:tyrosine-protein kinase receptor TYRO3-like [Polypterus senegalus]|uniref:tyrosine-protein kinase receptor TYRO3-like n=1 Tax=Polypterus senegalus TaxID=55291 RepID=UPI001965E6F0|nr:tyrosine-protein kinase receptor TYRO3-like [Polypterus senegalus]